MNRRDRNNEFPTRRTWMVSIVPKAPGGAVKEWDCRRSQRRTFHPGRTHGTVPAEVFAWIAKPNQINREGRTQRTPEPRADTVNCGYAAFRAHRRGSPGPGRQTSDPRDAFGRRVHSRTPRGRPVRERTPDELSWPEARRHSRLLIIRQLLGP